MTHNFKGNTTPTPTAPSSAPTADRFHLMVDADDIRFLKDLQRKDYGAEHGHPLRLWWDPMAKRGQGDIVPTHVTIMAETLAMREEVLAFLLAHRQRRGSLKSTGSELFGRLPVAEKPEANKPNYPWNLKDKRSDGDDNLQAA